MTTKIIVPEMGESVLEATVSRWHKKEGDAVKVGDILVELETDKVNLEVGAKSSGILSKVDVPEGGDVKVLRRRRRISNPHIDFCSQAQKTFDPPA